MKQINYAPFQKESIEAAVKHFEEHDHVLCADEAGLGKTIIARGIIERMANQKLEQEFKRCGKDLAQWWDKFKKSNPKPQDYNIRGHKIEALDGFQKACGLGLIKRKRDPYDDLMNRIGKALSAQPTTLDEDRDRFCAVIKNLHQLIIMENSRGRYRQWDMQLPKENNAAILPAEPFRVLYVCCNLEIAEQNTRRLTPLAQNSDRGKEGKPDRLSVLGHYLLRYPTPYLEIMPITATISTGETPGNETERNILNIPKGEAISTETRLRYEEASLALYRPDLVIFDEFQNFSDILSLCNKAPQEFEEYLANLSGEDCEQRRESMKRIRRIFQLLFARKEGKKPKLLMLSATPFHAAQYHSKAQQENLNQIDLDELLKFMGGSREQFEQAEDKESYLYDICGILRNERIRLLGKDNTAYHLLACDGAGLLPPALRLRGQGQGNCAKKAVFTTPHVDKVPEIYTNNREAYSINATVEVDPAAHPRYQRLLQVVTAKDADDVTEEIQPGLTRNITRLNQLLWIPPSRPSQPLAGVFAEYAHYSKTLVYSNLKVTPDSVTTLLNSAVQYSKLSMNSGECDRLKKYLGACLDKAGFSKEKKVNQISDNLCQYILNYGGAALGEKATAEEVQKYCEDGCLVDVLREYGELLEAPSDGDIVWTSIGKNIEKTSFAFATPMLTVTPEIRGRFNAPFLPFVLMTTSIGAEGLDFHLYCNRLAHYTAPASVVELEQKNGRIDRRNSLAVRRWWAQPGMQFRWQQNRGELEGKSGGLTPFWDAGEGNLHYYFFYTEYTKERQWLIDLLDEQKAYREQIGAHKSLGVDTYNLCPYLRNKST